MKWLWLLLLIPIKIQAGVLDTYIQIQQVPNGIYYYKVYNDNKVANFPASFKIANGKYVYCLEPGIGAGSGMYSSQSFYVPLNYGFSEEQIKTMQLYATFGYDYPNHQTLNYYLATQELIWQTTGLLKSFRWQYATGSAYSVDLEKNNIVKLVNQYQKIPILSSIVTGKIGDAITLKDSNYALNNYQVTSNNALITSNELSFTIPDYDVIKLVKGNSLVKPSTFFYRNSDQLMASLNINDLHSIELTVDGYYEADIKVEVVDENNNFVESEMGLYQNGELVAKKYTVDGGLTFENISEGYYEIKQLSVNNGYYLDNNSYYLVIDSNNDRFVKLVNQAVTTSIKIHEYSEVFDFNSQSYLYQPSNYGKYQIWQDDQLIQEIDALSESKPLKIGTYQIKQINTSDALILNESLFELDTSKSNEVTVTNAMKKTNLSITSIDAISNKKLAATYLIDNGDTEIKTNTNRLTLPSDEYDIKQIPINNYKDPAAVNLDLNNITDQSIKIINEPLVKIPQTDKYNYGIILLIIGFAYVLAKIMY